MLVTLAERTEAHVRIYFQKAGREAIRKFLPQKAKTVEEALEDYRKTLFPNATSYGATILADGRYIGDVWCYCIDREDTPNAMISYCIFEEEYWGRGIATEAVKLFLSVIQSKYSFQTLGAFTYAENIASIRVLEKNGFSKAEEFCEEGVRSVYMQRQFPIK